MFDLIWIDKTESDTMSIYPLQSDWVKSSTMELISQAMTPNMRPKLHPNSDNALQCQSQVHKSHV